MSELQTIRLGQVEYVIVPKAEYLKLRDSAGIPPGSVDALEYTALSIASDLRKAREESGLTQAALAKKLKVSQPMVSGAESGRVRVSDRYVRNVLKACGLPEGWSSHKPAKSRKRARKLA
jgi:ribosome-binding protein aMBF1 (putative translation factor)